VSAVAVMWLPWMWVSLRQSPISFRLLFSALARPAIASVGIAAALWLIRLTLPSESPLLSVAIGAVFAAVTIAVTWLVMPAGREEIHGLMRDIVGATFDLDLRGRRFSFSANAGSD
jgi:cobalamin synthase